MEEDEKTGTVDKILDTVQSFKRDKQSGNTGWIAGLVAAVLALIGIAVFAWQAWKSGRERAKLLHEKAVREEQEHQAQVDADLAENQLEKEAALADAAEIREEIDQLESDAAEFEAEREKARNIIRRIKTWKDVDAIVR